MENAIKRRNFKQFVQFAFIALMNTAVAVATMNSLLFIQPDPGEILLGMFNAASYVMAVLNSYFWNSRVTFKGFARGTKRQRFRFSIQALASLGINYIAFLAANNLLSPLGWPNWIRYNAALGISGAISSISSFMFIKYLVFSEMNDQGRGAVDKIRE
ncbi:GtrA family protein [Paenibacillus oralis]|uniref:GtrA family protein n=1 Tax=Paenibacillus oralis TaxID=2490856 RepID=A0A3P3UC57_9BACL|nr:GtrA family protein [Paenibacillus oralis]RRJ66043.1 GtrA family protein [Paenibacillus oralis]